MAFTMMNPIPATRRENGARYLRTADCFRGRSRRFTASVSFCFLACLGWSLGWLFWPAGGHAAEQILVFKDGKTLAYPYVKIRGDTVVVEMRINDRVEECVYPIAQIASLRWTEPEEWTEAVHLLEENREWEAIPRLESLRATFTPFKNIPGSYWLAAAGKLIDLYGKWERWEEFDLLCEEIAVGGLIADPAVQARLERYQMIRLLAKGNVEGAAALVQKLEREVQDEEDAAWLDLVRAEILLLRQQPEEALYACLRLPVFHAGLASLQPRALALSVRAFEGMKLPKEADRALAELQQTYPATREAESAATWLAQARQTALRRP